MRAAVLTALFLVVWFRWRERIGTIGFYVLFALMVTMSYSSWRLPGVHDADRAALATYRHARYRQLSLGYAVAFASYVVGLVVSLFTDLPSSPVIVWAMAVLGILLHPTARGNGEKLRDYGQCGARPLAADPVSGEVSPVARTAGIVSEIRLGRDVKD